MALRTKQVKGKNYYYVELSYALFDAVKKFSKYVGSKKPNQKRILSLEETLKKEIIEKISGKIYSAELLSLDEVIKSLLYRDLFLRRYHKLNSVQRRKFEVNQTILFTLTTLTTEDVDVDLKDVMAAYKKEAKLNARETISRNMLNAIEMIKENKRFDEAFILSLHKATMAAFETKNPGHFRQRQVYIHKRDEINPSGKEIAYRPPAFSQIGTRINQFIKWYNKSDLNPIEKSAQAHYEFYAVHPFLDGNKRIARLIFNKALLDESFPLINISENKESYFDSLMKSVEEKSPKYFIDFSLKEYFKQIKTFIENKK